MKYSVTYYRDFRYFDNIDEVILKYSHNNENIITFIKEKLNPATIAVIDICEVEDKAGTLPILKKVIKECGDRIIVKTTIDFFKELLEAEVPFFFGHYCTSLEQISAYISLGAKQVYVAEELGFNLKEVGEYCHDLGIKIRVIPNIAQYSAGIGSVIPDAEKFFIRPDDVELYEDYVDTLEFVGPGDRLSVLYEIYTSGKWLGDLKELIMGMKEDRPYPNTGIAPYFGQQRIKCKHKCMLNQCELCDEMRNLAIMMKDNGVEIRRTKEKEDVNESKINEKTSNIGRTENSEDTN